MLSARRGNNNRAIFSPLVWPEIEHLTLSDRCDTEAVDSCQYNRKNELGDFLKEVLVGRLMKTLSLIGDA